MIVLRNAQSLFKRVRISHQASDNLTACNQNSRITPLLQANP
ncbi:hypothetical protein RGC27_03380 [Helicobacter pylori]|nr:hypothetical protein [Helicobacter pylori]MDU9792933.1 hypothetical protein [Helicobacter pylori]